MPYDSCNKNQVTVLPDGLIQMYVPELKAGTIAEVIVLESSKEGEKRSLVTIIGKGRGCFSTSDEADTFIAHERRSWE